MPLKSHYEQLHNASGDVLAASFDGRREAQMASAHSYIEHLAKWNSALGTRKETQALQAAMREYQFALMTLSLGGYRSAFAALRLFIEMTFSAVRWSGNEQELREWLRGERDINWSALIDADTGVLGKKVLRLYSEFFLDEAPSYRALAVAAYRECSEFIHGNAVTYSRLPHTIGFDLATFDLWHKKADAARLVVTFCLAGRYLAELEPEQKVSLENGLLDILGHSPSVRHLLGAPVEAEND